MRTQAEHTANVKEIQRLRAALEQTQRELSNARIERDRLQCENDELRRQLEADELELAAEAENIRRIGERYGTRGEIAPPCDPLGPEREAP